MSEIESFSSSSCSSSDEGHSSCDEGEEIYDADMNGILHLMKTFNPYMYEPERDVSSASSSNESSDSFEEEISNLVDEKDNVEKVNSRVGHIDWCKCGECRVETREIDCLCCQEVDALNSKFDTEVMNCIIQSKDFDTLCCNETVLKNVLTGLHETKGDHLEKIPSNRSLRFAAYKQFIWWVFNYLGKGERRVIPSCGLWRIRTLFPEADLKYVNYSDGSKD